MKIETCRVFGNPKCFSSHCKEMSKKARTFSNIDSCNEKNKKNYSPHGLLKQKFIRLMHSSGQCCTNELRFMLQPISFLFFFKMNSIARKYFCYSFFRSSAKCIAVIFVSRTRKTTTTCIISGSKKYHSNF